MKKIILVSIIGFVVIAGVVAAFIGVNLKSDNKTTSTNQARSTENSQRRGGFAPQNGDYSDFCAQWQERQNQNFTNRPMPANVNRPENGSGQMEEMNQLIEEICADGKVSDEEKKLLEESMPSPGNGQAPADGQR